MQEHKKPYVAVHVNGCYLNDYEHTTFKAASKHGNELADLLNLIDGITFEVWVYSCVPYGDWESYKQDNEKHSWLDYKYENNEKFKARMQELREGQ